MKTYLRKEVLEITGIELERFNAWVDRGYITASIEKKKGYRTFREFSEEDIYAIGAFRFMIEECEIPREVAGEAARAWRDFLKEHPRGKHIETISISVFEQGGRKKYAISAPLMDDRGVLAPPLAFYGGEIGTWSHTMLVNLKPVLAHIKLRM